MVFCQEKFWNLNLFGYDVGSIIFKLLGLKTLKTISPFALASGALADSDSP